MNKTHILPTTIAMAIGISGVLLVLFAWHLPPFRSAEPTTENAYIRGRVTSIAPQLSGYVSEVYVHDFQEVKQGDPIARIDDRIYRQKLAQAQAGLETARAALAVSEQNVRSAEAVRRANEEIGARNALARGGHERLDGNGYPRGLQADAIALETRIITTADIFDAPEHPYTRELLEAVL